MRQGLDRRAFLRSAAVGAAGISLAGVAAACGGDRRTATVDPSVPRVPTRTDPVTLPVDETQMIPSGLEVERGTTLRVYQWREYLYDDVLDAFARRYAASDVDVSVESFSDMNEALARLREPDADFDVFFPTIDVLGRLVAEGLARPLNHDYLPNAANLWPEFRPDEGPFFDRGARYTVPYTVYSSGIAWRTDLVTEGDAADPFALPWNERYRGRTGFLDQYREALALALARAGVTDVNTTDAEEIRAATTALVEALRSGAVVSQDGAYDALPRGELVAHQAWSGDALTALTYGRRDPREVGRTLAYRWPMDGSGWVGCDLTAVCARGRNPVLAHAFVNHLLDAGVAFENFTWNGYQPPLEEITLERTVRGYPGVAEMGHHCVVLTPEQFARGQMFHALDPRADARWLDAWQRVLGVAA
ncbi:MAG TPA: spermidine/putrescine ABC transporter substrate-binding protein [Actinomycetota bacterium]|nr:spermidine/putrescine ABC transporter substrate-binding protein [Actinomycetota bacterium]